MFLIFFIGGIILFYAIGLAPIILAVKLINKLLNVLFRKLVGK